jgi:transposase
MDAVGSAHPTDQALRCYGLDKLDGRRAEEVNKHLEHWSDRRERVTDVSADSFLERARAAQKCAGHSTSAQSRLGGSQIKLLPSLSLRTFKE